MLWINNLYFSCVCFQSFWTISADIFSSSLAISLIPLSFCKFKVFVFVRRILCFRMPKNNSTGARSGEYEGKNKYFTPHSCRCSMTIFDWCTCELSITIKISASFTFSFSFKLFTSCLRNWINILLLVVSVSIVEYE